MCVGITLNSSTITTSALNSAISVSSTILASNSVISALSTISVSNTHHHITTSGNTSCMVHVYPYSVYLHIFTSCLFWLNDNIDLDSHHFLSTF